MSDTPKKAKATVGQVVLRNSLLFFIVFILKITIGSDLKKPQTRFFCINLSLYSTFLAVFNMLYYCEQSTIAGLYFNLPNKIGRCRFFLKLFKSGFFFEFFVFICRGI